eukprot:CAMPEP_0203663260 /NCGR_PEP_ID=MMETSP0090-20130426/911_1 /ASSEMBLY_ACC=CAM_ASM_001088 /TAXON_ID=426623 /ORGANISM="Chaetoceros affinis, Strain CCMP159" /LENGTH=547 /DNA_ID=CAMNT_0050526145 /DNA_START=16 /DNA_END=1659 /DNA_ORIENTATION=-
MTEESKEVAPKSGEDPRMEPESPSPVRKAQSSSRARAEARRRRILEKSKDRLSTVSGDTKNTNTKNAEEVSISTNTGTGMSPSPPDPEIVTLTEGSNENEGPEAQDAVTPTATTATTTATEKNENTSKGSARLAQMRRRRYKKSAGAASATATATSTVKTSAPSTTQGGSIGNVDGAGDAEKTQTNKEDSSNNNAEKPSASTSTADETPVEKKKYLGVVKMRRKMLAEKKASEAQGIGTSSKNASPTTVKVMKKEKNTVSLRPIITQFLTIVLLFLAGFDVGLQNHVVVKQETPSIHSNFALSDHGIGALKLIGANTPSQRPNEIIIQDPLELNDDIEGEGEEFVNVDNEEEEFSEVKPAGVSASSTKEPNIDPLFGVDLDELTAGDGFLMAAARMAVSGHRMLTYLFFTLPLSFVAGLFSLPKRIFVNPPILFLCAVIIRYLGKHVFGGSIPDFDKMLEAEISESDAMKSKEGVAEGIANTDFVSMGLNFVKNFIKSNFPRAVLVYTIFQDARSDMFVVFCGFFLGLVIPVHLIGHEITSSVSEEL